MLSFSDVITIPDFPFTQRSTRKDIERTSRHILATDEERLLLTHDQRNALAHGQIDARKRAITVWHQAKLLRLVEAALECPSIERLSEAERAVLVRRYRGNLKRKQLDAIRTVLNQLLVIEQRRMRQAVKV